MTARNKLCVALPLYNEEENVKPLVLSWLNMDKFLVKENIQLELVLINDGSQDETLKICKELMRQYGNVKIVNHNINKGLGEALNSALTYAIDTEATYLCMMDGDQTHRPHYIISMLRKLKEEQLDCVIASRFQKGARVEGLSLFRKLMTLGARFVYKMRLRIPHVRDYTCGYRLYQIDILRKLQKQYGSQIVKEKSFVCMAELLYKVHIVGGEVGEVPFTLQYQLKQGTSKMNIAQTAKRSLRFVRKMKDVA